jgi:hypothetical protein
MTEDLGMDSRDRVKISGIQQVDPGTDHILRSSAAFRDSREDDLETSPRLDGDVWVA